jgi:hypothetical protein
MLCCAVLCCAVLCCAVLCCAVLFDLLCSVFFQHRCSILACDSHILTTTTNAHFVIANTDNTLRTRQGLGLLRDFVQATTQACALAGCDPSRQRIVFLDYGSYEEELKAMGADTKTSALQIWDRGLLVNRQYAKCASASDPRDDKTSECLWTGNGDIPNGNRCSDDIDDDSRGCVDQCGVDGFCRAVECSRFKENDWFAMNHREPEQNGGFLENSTYVSFEVCVHVCMFLSISLSIQSLSMCEIHGVMLTSIAECQCSLLTTELDDLVLLNVINQSKPNDDGTNTAL